MLKKILCFTIIYILLIVLYPLTILSSPLISSNNDIDIYYEINKETKESYTGLCTSSNNSIDIYVNTDILEGEITYNDPILGKMSSSGLFKRLKLPIDEKHFTYTAPDYLDIDNFDKLVYKNGLYAYPLNLEFIYTDKEGNNQTIDKTIYLYLPPVGLLYSSLFEPNNLSYIQQNLTNEKYNTFDINLSLNEPEYDTINIHDSINKAHDSYLNKNIKINDLYLISHGLSGLAARKYIEESSLYKGNIRKLIMLSCPNKGIETSYSGLYLPLLFDDQKQIVQKYTTNSTYINNLSKYVSPDTQYANIYSNSYIGTDGLISEESAVFPNIYSKQIKNASHSSIFAQVGPPITSNPLVFSQIKSWLIFDIPKADTNVYTFEFFSVVGNVEVSDFETSHIYLADTKDNRKIQKHETINTDKNSYARITLAKNLRVFGYIDLYENSSIYFQNTSNNLISVLLKKGSARFFTYPNETTNYKVLSADNNRYIHIKGNGNILYTKNIFDKVKVQSGYVKLDVADNFQSITTTSIRTGNTKLINSNLNISDSIILEDFTRDSLNEKSMKIFQTGTYSIDKIINYLFNAIPNRIHYFENSYINIGFGSVILFICFLVLVGIIRLVINYFDFRSVIPFEKINYLSDKFKLRKKLRILKNRIELNLLKAKKSIVAKIKK